MKFTEAVMPPLSLSGITPDWLTEARAARYFGVVVGDAVFGTPIHGTGTNMRITFHYARQPAGVKLPETMWLKSCYEQHFEAMAPSRVFEMEALFYRDLSPRLNVRVPHYYYVGIDENTHQGLMLLEDLESAGASFGNATRPYARSVCPWTGVAGAAACVKLGPELAARPLVCRAWPATYRAEFSLVQSTNT
jgi:hypothetical protein